MKLPLETFPDGIFSAEEKYPPLQCRAIRHEMKRILNFGSLNIDHVYKVPHFVQPGETLSSLSYNRFPGGKGLNQSIALARAGASVSHAGKIGTDGTFLKTLLEENHVDCSLIEISERESSGHAVIQVSESGENCIVLSGGTNRSIGSTLIENAFSAMDDGDFLLLQNEISSMPEIIRKGAEKGMRVFLNPAPMNSEILACPLELIETLIVNETEGAALAGDDVRNPTEIIEHLRRHYPMLDILMTLGSKGAIYCPASVGDILFTPAVPAAQVVDTTAAGDTFIGYYLAGITCGTSPEAAMKKAAAAASLCVARPGAASSIPWSSELR